MPSNERTLENGFAKAYRIIEDTLYNSLSDAAEKLLVRASTNRQFIGFTGNTQTSYMAGIYVGGRLAGIVYQQNWTAPPVRAKIPKGKTIFLQYPYEGRERGVTGRVDIGEPFGAETSLKFLQNHKVPSKSVGLVLTTGTEYSEYIESVQRLDVLTNTFGDAARILDASWRKIV